MLLSHLGTLIYLLALMKFNSIKTRLLLIVTICLLGMLILVGNQIYNTNRLISLHNQSKQFLQLSNELLQLRRHEKDFLLRLDPAYVEQFEQQGQQFDDKVSEIRPFLLKLGEDVSLIDQLQSTLLQYREGFINLVNLQKDIGLDENSGYQGAFREATHQLEKHLSTQNQTALQVLLLQLRRHEKDFLMRKREEYVEKHERVYKQLYGAINQGSLLNKSQLLNLLQDYQQGFMKLVEAYRRIGLDHTQGLLGEFRQQAHQLEYQLSEVENNVSKMIVASEKRVETNSFFIMSVTTLALIFLLVKSYFTFQRAFLNFVMFFYRCKREYQHMDGKKLGFAEFKYLATIANEMIDARREIERQLHDAKKQITDLKNLADAANQTTSFSQ